MNYHSLKTRNIVSTWMSLFFFLILCSYLGFIEFFKDSKIEVLATNLLKDPINKEIINDVYSIRFKNRIGDFSIQKNQEDESWTMKEPRVMPAQNKTMNSILKSLSQIHVKTIYEFEPINIQSFSLDKPVMEIDLFTKSFGKIKLKMGLINPIDNTSYLTVSGHNHIFQVEILQGKMEKLELSNFIDSQVFSSDIDDVISFKLFRGKTKEVLNNLTFSREQWNSQKYNTIDTTNTMKKIENILSIKTHMIIDKQNDELKTYIQNYLDNPIYTIEVKTKSNKMIKYTISSLIKGITELKLDKKNYFLMTASDREYPYVIGKEYLDEFIIRYTDLK